MKQPQKGGRVDDRGKQGKQGKQGGGGWGERFATRSLLVFQCDNAKSQTVIRSDNVTLKAGGRVKECCAWQDLFFCIATRVDLILPSTQRKSKRLENKEHTLSRVCACSK